MTPTPNEILEWSDHPVTKYFLDKLDREIEGELEAYSVGAYLSDNPNETLKKVAMSNGKMLGFAYLGQLVQEAKEIERERDLSDRDETAGTPNRG